MSLADCGTVELADAAEHPPAPAPLSSGDKAPESAPGGRANALSSRESNPSGARVSCVLPLCAGCPLGRFCPFTLGGGVRDLEPLLSISSEPTHPRTASARGFLEQAAEALARRAGPSLFIDSELAGLEFLPPTAAPALASPAASSPPERPSGPLNDPSPAPTLRQQSAPDPAETLRSARVEDAPRPAKPLVRAEFPGYVPAEAGATLVAGGLDNPFNPRERRRATDSGSGVNNTTSSTGAANVLSAALEEVNAIG